MNNMHGTTIVGVRKNGSVTIAGDGQVSLGNTIIKGTAQKIRSINNEGYEVILGLLDRPPMRLRL